MIISNGKNDFKNNTFDKFRWSANTYETTDEIIRCFRELGVFEKRVRGITAIGAVLQDSLQNWKEEAVQVLYDAGIIDNWDLSAGWIKMNDGITYNTEECLHYLKNASSERIVRLFEPLLILFEDGNVMELLPCAPKGLRIGYNSLPKDMRNGINRFEFDVGKMFNQFVSGKDFFKVRIDSTVSTITYSRNRAAREIRRKKYMFDFLDGYLIMEESQSSEYTLSFSRANKINCWDLAGLGENSYQETILEGWHGGGSVNIYPIKGSGWDELHFDTDNPEVISVHYDTPALFWPLLQKYFDPELPVNKECSEGHYDFYYCNYYTKDSIIKMVQEALRELEKVRSLSPTEQCNALSCGYRDQTEEEMLLRIEEAISFTERFSERLLGMALNTPEYNFICFAGP